MIVVISVYLERGLKWIGGSDRLQRAALITAIILAGAVFESAFK